VATLWMLDFLFPLAYASLLRGLYVWLSRRLGAPTSRLLELAPWAAAALDFAENLLQIGLVGAALSGADASGAFRVGVLAMSLCAAAKWSLILTSLLGTTAVLLRSEVAWAVWTCRFAAFSVLLGSLPLVGTSQGQDLLRPITNRVFLSRAAGAGGRGGRWEPPEGGLRVGEGLEPLAPGGGTGLTSG
jgi:hypothetical protein